MNVLCNNKKSSFKYSFVKKLEAGLVLSGWEVKSLKDGNGQISESYISIKKDELFLCNAHIKTINIKNNHIHQNPTQNRKLLLNRKEINMLQGQSSQKGIDYSSYQTLYKERYHQVRNCVGQRQEII